ncbi:MAG: hypothetical protein NTV34_16680, partial [Proteobacteria bacterium]|nr:hypothetical protein [Pseudomonadota bacterium]
MRKMTFALFAILSALMFQGCKEQNFGASGGDGGKKPGQNNGKPKVPSGGTTANGPSPQPSNQPTPQPTTQPNPEILRTDEGLLKSPGNLTSIVGIGFEDSGTDRDFNDMSFCMDMDKTEHLFISGRTIKVASNKSL